MFSPHKTRPTRTVQRVLLLVALLVCIVVAALAVEPGVAAAHSDLAGSSPQNGETVVVAVSEIELVFANPIDFDKSSFEVVDEAGGVVPLVSTSIGVDDATVTIVLVTSIHQGAVGVGYTVVSDDSHPRPGSITFAVDAPMPTPTPAPTEEPTPTPAPAAAQVATPAPTEELITAPIPTEEPLAANGPVTSEPSSSDSEGARSHQNSEAAVAPRSENDEVSPAPLPDLSEFLAPSASLGRMIDAQTAVRAVGYAAAAVLIGGLLFFAQIAGGLPSSAQRRVIQLAALATVVAAIALVGLQAGIADGGAVGALMNPLDWTSVLRGQFAVGVLLRILGGAIGLAIAGGVGPVLVGAATVTALSFPFLGHGVSRDPMWLVFPADLVHVVVVSIWTGGLLMLVIGLRRGATSNEIVERFSTAAGRAVVAAAITGIVLAATELEAFGELFSTTYGKRLLLKIVLVAGIVGLGAVHRFRLIPALRREPAGARPLRKMLLIGSVEVVVMAAVVIVTTLLVNAAT